jgi:PAS domain S-box-containing protein
MTVLFGSIGVAAILLLALNVGRDLRFLNSASSDNVQWTLSQAEVEFIEFEVLLDATGREAVPELASLRRRFDIFYSRIKTLSQASIYVPVRQIPEFSRNLEIVHDYLDATVPFIDADDHVLTDALPELSSSSVGIHSNVRRLSNAGLSYFAAESDRRRVQISKTLAQMAAGVTLLMLALLFLSLYLGHLNKVNIRRREQAIQTSKRMNVVTSTALDAVVVCDVNGRILDFNEAAVQIFGYTAEQAIGADLAQLIVPEEYRDGHEAGMQRMRATGETRVVGKGRIKLDAMRANGEIFPVELAVQSAEAAEGLIFISFLRDISRRIEVEKNLVEARDRALEGEKAKTDFLATMSHEIRTPLNGLLGNMTLLQDTQLDEQQSRYIKNMDTSGKLLMSHISDVLDITKYDAGKLKLRPVVMNLSTLLQDIIDNQSGAAFANSTTLSWVWLGDSSYWIYGDNERIQHVLMNVIGNAVKFTKNGVVSVEARIEDDKSAVPFARIKVKDTGIGMSAVLKDQIFDDFMTGDVSYVREVGGTGLGLGIALRFVSAMGGTIEVQSEEGAGSVFEICFPVTPADTPVVAPVQLTEPEAPDEARRAAHILLVEDNEINRFVAREMLTAYGHTVTEAHNGQIAVELAAKTNFDMILMDISMPVLDGRAATRAIRASNGLSAQAPIVALTANAMASEQDAFLSDGMNSVLTKPLSRESLVSAIAKHSGMGDADGSTPRDALSFVDPEHLGDLRETLGVAAVQTLLDRFNNEVQSTIQIFAGDLPLEDIASHAHRISGSAAALGALELRKTLARIEFAAKQSNVDDLSKAINELPGVWWQTKPLMQA